MPRKPRKTKNINRAGKIALASIVGEWKLANAGQSPTTEWVLTMFYERYPDWEGRFFRAEPKMSFE